MTCPNCQRPYSENETICKHCGTPLGNAAYKPVSSHYRHRKKSRKKWPFVLLLLLFILIVGGIIGYQYYISMIKKNCQQTTDEIFTMAQEMDFSSVDPAYLPDFLKEDPYVSDYIEDKFQQLLDENVWTYILEAGDIEIDGETLCSEIIRSASYEITDITADYHSCTVTVHTENIDFTKIPETISQRFTETQEEDSLWDSMKKIFSYMFSSDEEEQDFSELLYEWYEEARETAPQTDYTGTIVYGIVDGQWTLQSFDEKLIYCYYGLQEN